MRPLRGGGRDDLASTSAGEVGDVTTSFLPLQARWGRADLASTSAGEVGTCRPRLYLCRRGGDVTGPQSAQSVQRLLPLQARRGVGDVTTSPLPLQARRGGGRDDLASTSAGEVGDVPTSPLPLQARWGTCRPRLYLCRRGGAARWGVGVGVGVGVEVEEEEEDEADAPQLLRTRSDASFMEVTRRRSKTRSNARDLQRLRTHRFSINGHFYNHKTSVFTPAYGSVTNVRVNSSMTTLQVLSLLLHKFRVAQYIKFEIPVLDSFVEKLKEEEEREISKLTKKFTALKSNILHQLEGKVHSSDTV
ncbi:hypothetical protein CRUP_036166 [Coryphaenoides rupestris]|nr:hypothetical protein CRUP_036166 [Coryphaenoides rupestris]